MRGELVVLARLPVTASKAEARHRKGPFLFGTILIFPSGREETEMDCPIRGKDEERRIKDRERHWCPLLITSPPGLTNEGPNQRFICSSLLFSCTVYLRPDIAVDKRQGNDESIGGATIAVCYMNSCRLACLHVCACVYVGKGSCERV